VYYALILDTGLYICILYNYITLCYKNVHGFGFATVLVLVGLVRATLASIHLLFKKTPLSCRKNVESIFIYITKTTSFFFIKSINYVDRYVKFV